ncbi:DUF4136 domain-containing protein [Kineobactrum sediminis]|uniref:DUF4136 domain-containing protein n=1 Tax=Kineobactrum sediminis TaxID=1905677 RepID=A0A2N5Y726_9GAMM|nr:DUF4136 domain-containing protein [Kineobactrum sediminis]PLW84187.1 DUF4136 domain-containing protein [Kineobactrum sediminis]
MNIKPVSVTCRIGLLILGAVFITACAVGPPKPDIDFKPGYDFSEVQTVAFYENSGLVEGDNPLQLSDMQKNRIDAAIAHALRNKGLELVDDADKADMLVSWHLVTQFKTDVRTRPYPSTMSLYYGYNRYSLYNCWGCIGTPTDISVRDYTEGTFIVDMIDPELEQSVWRGIIRTRLYDEQVQNQAEYNEAAEAIFAKFPPPTSV